MQPPVPAGIIARVVCADPLAWSVAVTRPAAHNRGCHSVGTVVVTEAKDRETWCLFKISRTFVENLVTFKDTGLILSLAFVASTVLLSSPCGSDTDGGGGSIARLLALRA